MCICLQFHSRQLQLIDFEKRKGPVALGIQQKVDPKLSAKLKRNLTREMIAKPVDTKKFNKTVRNKMLIMLY